jgi:MalT-like TPR region
MPACNACAALSSMPAAPVTARSTRERWWRSVPPSSTRRADATRRPLPRSTRPLRSPRPPNWPRLRPPPRASSVTSSSFVAATSVRNAGLCARRIWPARMAPSGVGSHPSSARVLTDTAHYGRALEELTEALRLSSEAGDGTQVAFTLAMLGRAHLLRDELDAARAAFDESLACARRENWTAFTPWPEALRGDVDLASGATDAAVERYEHAFALACQLGDPCWEGIAARGLGLAAARDDIDKALDWLAEARTRCVRLPDAWLWIEAYTLDALCSLAVEHRLPAAPAWIEGLAALAARTGMRQFAASAHVYRGRLGDDAALTAARLLAAEIDNPALSAMLRDPIAGGPARSASLGAESRRPGGIAALP